MMYAIFRDRGKQYKVKEGEVIDLDKLPKGTGKEVTFSDVLYYQNDKDLRVGKPTLPNARVRAEVLKEERKGPKVVAVMWRKRESFRRKKGQRARFSTVKISKIEA